MKNKFLVFSLILASLLMASCSVKDEGEISSTTKAEVISTVEITTSVDTTIASSETTAEETTKGTTATTTVATTIPTTVETTTVLPETTTVVTTIKETEKHTTTEISSAETEEPKYVELNKDNNGTNDELNPTFKKMKEKNKYYYRNLLSKDERDIYDAIFKYFSNPAKYVTVKNPYGPADESPEAMQKYSDKLFRLVTFVWVDNSFISQDLSNSMQFGYIKKSNEFVFIGADKQTADIKAVVNDYQGYLDRVEQAYKKAEEIALAMPSDITTQKDMALYFHDYLINNATSNTNGKENIHLNDEAYGPLVLGKGTCEGFTNAFSMLCHIKGIESVGVMYNGKTEKDIGHIWNLACLDGVYTQIDVFHDNVVFVSGSETIRYTYFGMSDQEIADKLKKSDNYQIESVIADVIPECHDVKIDFQ